MKAVAFGAMMILLSVTLFLIFNSNVMRVTGAPVTQWSKTYGGGRASSVQQTGDGGYIIAGYSQSSGGGNMDLYIVKTDSTGTLNWNKTYGGQNRDRAYSVVQTNDGEYALAGETDSFGAGIYDFWLIKTDSDGNMVWNQTYGGTGLDSACSMVQTDDGGYVIAGYTNSSGAGGYDSWLVKTDSAGNMQWNKTYGGAEDDFAYSLVQTSDEGYALAGYTLSFGARGEDFWLVKTDSAGNMQWNKTYGGIMGEEAYSLIQASDGGYALTGPTWSFGAGISDFWLVKTDSAGNIQWNKTYGGSSFDMAESVAQTSDGGYILAGAWGYSCRLVKTDSVGNMTWNGAGGAGVSWGESVVQTIDGGYIVAGVSALSFWLMKLESELHDIAIDSVKPSENLVVQGRTTPINVTVENQGDYAETFNVTAFANSSVIQTQDVSLRNGDSTTVTFMWNTTELAIGNYIISVIADTVPGETDEVDNTCIDGAVRLAKAPLAYFAYSPNIPTVGETTTFNGSSSYDPDGTIIEFSWSFGDNQTALGVIASHAYTSTGNFTVTFTVTDDDELTSSLTKPVVVLGAEPPPTTPLGPTILIVGVSTAIITTSTFLVLRSRLRSPKLYVALPERTRKLFLEDVIKRGEKISRFERKYSVEIHPADSLEDAIRKLDIRRDG